MTSFSQCNVPEVMYMSLAARHLKAVPFPCVLFALPLTPQKPWVEHYKMEEAWVPDSLDGG